MNKRVRKSSDGFTIHYLEKENFDNKQLRQLIAKIFLEGADSTRKLTSFKKHLQMFRKAKTPAFELSSSNHLINSSILTYIKSLNNYNHSFSLRQISLQLIIASGMQPLSIPIFCLLLALATPFTFVQLGISSTILTINQPSSYTFTLNRNQSNVIGFTTAYNTIPVNATDTVVVFFPTAYTINTAQVTCNSILVDGVPITNFTCGSTATSVSFLGAFANISNVFVQKVVVTIGAVTNPTPAMSISGFWGKIGLDTSATGTKSISLTAGAFSNCAITFTPTTVNNPNSVMVISVTPTNSLTSNATITVTFPGTTWTRDISAQALPIGSTMACSNHSANIKTGVICTNTSSNTFVASNLFFGAMSSAFSFQVGQFLSPPSNQPADLITLTSKQGTFSVDTCSIYPSGLTAAALSNFTITSIGTMTVNSLIPLAFYTSFVSTISQNDYFTIIFPTGSTYAYSSVGGTGQPYDTPVSAGQSVQIKHLISASSVPLYSGDYTLVFRNFLASPSTLPTNNFTMTVYRNTYPILTGTANITAVADSLVNASALPAVSTVLTTTSYVFTIPLTQPLSASGMIRITMPSQVTIATNAANCATLTASVSTVNLNPVCSYATANSILFSSINGTASANITTGQTLTLTVNGLTNPSDTAQSGTFAISTFYSSNQAGVTQTGTAAGVTATVGSIALNTTSVTPSDYTVLKSPVTYTIAFNNTYAIPQGGKIELRVPIDVQIIVSLTVIDNTYTKYKINGGTALSGASSSSLNTTFYQINFTNIAQGGAIAAGSKIELILEGICKNPTNTRIVSPFAITTYSSANAAIETITGLTVQMTAPASFGVFDFSRANQTNAATTAYKFTLQQAATLPNGTLLHLTFPTEIAMTSSSTCTDLSNVSIPCILNSFQSLTVTLPQITGGSQFGVWVSNVKNPASYRPTATNVTATTADAISTYASSTFAPAMANTKPSLFQNVAYAFANRIYGAAESLTITLTPSVGVSPTFVLVSLPISGFTINTLTVGYDLGFTSGAFTSTGSTINITGMSSAQFTFTISGFTAPTGPLSQFTTVSSFQNSYLIDQNSSFIQFTVNCPLPCKTCQSANQSACLSCYNNALIAPQKYYHTVNLSCLSACPSSYYDSGSLVCAPCSTGSPNFCLDCVGLATNCTSCNTTSSNPVLNITNSSGFCQSCPTAYYLQVSVSQCVPCNTATYFCSTCLTLITCVTCVPGRFLLGTSCVSTCTAGYYIPNSGSWTCDSCAATCKQCQGTTTNCTSCHIGTYLLNGLCQSTCPSPLVTDNNTNTCINCQSPCRSCSITANNCTACFVNSTLPYLTTIASNGLGTCNSTCSSPYYGDLANGACKLCSTLGIGCSDCSSQTTCNSCDTGRVLYLSSCLTAAPPGYYNNSGVAALCSSNCATCQALNNCTSCIGALGLQGITCVSTCSYGKIILNNSCVACSATAFCETCSGSITFCTKCIYNATNTVYLTSGQCVPASGCPNYTYPNPNTTTCQPCTAASHCQTCTSSQTCKTCVNGYFFSTVLNNTCVVAASCTTGTVPIDRTCLPCTPNCSTCTGSTTFCTSCINGTYLYNTSSPTCVTTCPSPLLINTLNQTCSGCHSTCATCSVQANNCTSCVSSLLLQGNSCQSTCNTGYYPLGGLCLICPGNCSACVSNVSCTACTNSTYLYITTCVAACPSARPVIDINGVCSTCTDIYCSQCDSSNFCSLCYFPRVVVQGSCQTGCPTDYVLDTAGTSCVYSPGSSGTNGTTATLTNSLTAASTFPVPFTVAAGFIAIACLMSKFQYSSTFIYGALYALWGFIQWAALCFLVLYYYLLGGTTMKLSYLLILGGLAGIYLLNIIFFPIQTVSLRNDKRLASWLSGTFNSCWYWSSTLIGVICTNKFKNIIFCKLFNFTVFSARLENIHCLRSFYAFGFFAFLPALAVLAGTAMLVSQTTITYNQLFMAQIDVLILTILGLILAVCHTSKPQDYFEDTDQDGLKINKRIQSFDEVLNEHIAPSVYGESNRSHLLNHDSARKFNMVGNTLSLSEDMLSNRSASVRDISIQAQQILGQRSFISRLNTEQISQFSMFQHKNRDISIQMDQHKQMIDMSVGEEVMVNDVSIGPATIQQHDVSISARGVDLRDVSVDQTPQIQNQISIQYSNDNREVSVQMDRPGQEEVSIQMDKPDNHEVSIQLSQPQQHEISIQEVPLYVDETVHMTRDQADLAIQCNAQIQQVSVQYSAKPLIEYVQQNLPSQTQLSYSHMQDQPTDLSIQRRMMQGHAMPQQKGLKAELELDIEEKLERKKGELEQMQRERWEREKEEARRNFQSKVMQKEEEVPVKGKKQSVKQEKKFNAIFNNQSEQMPSSLMHTEQMIEVNFPPRPPRPTTARTERELINMLSGDNNQDFSKRSQPRPHNDSRSSKGSAFRGKVKIQHGNILMQQQPELFDQDELQDTFQQQQLQGHNTLEQYPSVDKSRSTANITGRMTRKNDNILEDSEEEVEKEKKQDSINMHPLQAHHHRNYREEDIEMMPKKTNLNKFLQNRRGNPNSNKTARNMPVEEDDALSRQIQRPLAPQRSQQLLSASNSKNKNKKKPANTNLNHIKPEQFEFDNNDHILIPDDFPVQEDALERQAKKVLPRKKSQKKLPQRDLLIQRPRRDSESKNYMKDTFNSKQKNKSLEKIYLNKLPRK